MFIQQRLPGQTNSFGNGGFAHLPIPGGYDLVDRFTAGQRIQHLPDHDARALEGRLAVADFRIGDDVFAQFDSFLGGMPSVLNGGNLRGRGGCFKLVVEQE